VYILDLSAELCPVYILELSAELCPVYILELSAELCPVYILELSAVINRQGYAKYTPVRLSAFIYSQDYLL
jgi:hypothetical protein